MSLSNISPVKRLEYFLQDIADGKTTATKTPVRRIEEFLRRISVKVASGGSGGDSVNIYRLVGATDPAIPAPPAGYTPDPAKYSENAPVFLSGDGEVFKAALSIPMSGPGTAGPTWLYDNLATGGDPGQYNPGTNIVQIEPETANPITDDPGARYAYLTPIDVSRCFAYTIAPDFGVIACTPDNLTWAKHSIS